MSRCLEMIESANIFPCFIENNLARKELITQRQIQHEADRQLHVFMLLLAVWSLLPGSLARVHCGVGMGESVIVSVRRSNEDVNKANIREMSGDLVGHFELHHLINTWWRHEMEAFSALLGLCEGNHLSPVDSLHKGPVTRSYGVFFGLRLNKRLGKQSRRRWSAWTNGWANNRDADDLRRHRVHYDVIVMKNSRNLSHRN